MRQQKMVIEMPYHITFITQQITNIAYTMGSLLY